MGTGDWNDGLNLVGAGGKGESMWLGWFLYPPSLLSANWLKAAASATRGGVAAPCHHSGRIAGT